LEVFTGFALATQPLNLATALAGVVVGVLVGSLPGLTATMAVALLVPFTFGLPPLASLLLLCGIHAGANYGGSVSAILLRTPGTPAAAATVLDGYPMAQSGQGRRAIELALYASVTGGLVSVTLMSFLSPLISRVALMFGPAEYAAIGVFGLTVIVGVAGPSLVKGLAAGTIGLTLTLVGLDPVAGYPRFTFGRIELLGGIPFLAALIGLFAMAEALRRIELMARGSAGLLARYDGVRVRLREWLGLAPTALKGGLIGSFTGVLPGAGADIAAFISYNEARRAARDRSRFGHGDPRGVVAAESANNGVTGGAMIPLLTLGIPGDAVTAVLIGAFTIQGIRPGPLLFQTHLHSIVYPLFCGLFVINLLMLAFGALSSGGIARLVRIPQALIVPAIIVLAVVGAYAMQFSLFDVYVMLGFGLVGYLLERHGYPLSPIVLALILGPLIESNLRRALVMHQANPIGLVSGPITLAFLALTAAALAFGILSRRRTILPGPPGPDPRGHQPPPTTSTVKE
jgi:putative tricarboxylic transport membrane protein